MDADTTTYVGLDLHKRAVAVSILLPGRADLVWLAFVAREETSDIWMVTGFDPQVTAPPAAIR